MKKIFAFLTIAFIAALLVYAGTPEVLNYQGVLKNRDGSVRPNEEATLTLQFVQSDVMIYSEEHRITTNANGYFSVHPGAGNALTGDFATIDWGAGAVMMRSILDGVTIAESHLTSVPYALYAQRVKGQDDMEYSIDSIADAHFQTSLQVDDQVITISQLQQTSDSIILVLAGMHDNDAAMWIAVDSLGTETDSLKITTDSLAAESYLAHALIDSMQVDIDTIERVLGGVRTDLDSVQFEQDTLRMDVDSLIGAVAINDSLLTTQLKQLSAQTDSLLLETPFFNATAFAPVDGGYHTNKTACESVPQRLRRQGLVVTFRSDTLNWRSIQFVHNDTTQWSDPFAWSNYGGYGNLILPFVENDSLTRLQVPYEYRRQGLIISYYNNTEVINEQYITLQCNDTAWAKDDSWMQLLLNSSTLDKMKAEIARIDTLVNDVKKGMQDMSTFGAWFYITHNEQFSQAGAVDYQGNEVDDRNMVHTPLIPLNGNWFVTAYGNSTYPAISFYSSPDMSSRLPYVGDTLTSDTWQMQTFDFSTDEIPASAQFFSVNMLLDKQENVTLKERTPITNVIDTSIKYSYREVDNVFSYIGAYVGCNGKRVINSSYRHSRFIALENNVYKIYSNGTYNTERVVPVVVFYSDATFGSCVGYDLGEVDAAGNTSRELIISPQTAPEGTAYFVVNWLPAQCDSYVQQGTSIDEAVIDATDRVSALETNLSCYSGRKLVTIGDSFTANSGNRGKHWQQWLAEWMGFVWSVDETRSGTSGYAPMGVGGAWITPNDVNSLSIRSLDVRRYSPNVIIVYGGQNDQIAPDKLGSIDDEPFLPSQLTDLTGQSTVNSIVDALEYINTKSIQVQDKMLLHINTSAGKRLYYLTNKSQWNSPNSWIQPRDSVSFYSAYKGIVELLCTKNPYATVYCMTLMQCDKSRYDQSLGSWEELDTLRRAKNEAIKEIADYYCVQLIDLWNKSGVTPYNATSLYNDWLHPNQYGYRKLAECIYRSMK